MGQPLVKTIEWIRMGPDLIFVLAGCIPLAIAVLFTLWQVVKHKKSAQGQNNFQYRWCQFIRPRAFDPRFFFEYNERTS